MNVPSEKVIRIKTFRDKHGFEYIYMHQYQNLILLQNIGFSNEPSSLIFYDTEKSEVVDPYEWNTYAAKYWISCICARNNLIFSIARLRNAYFLTCFDMKHRTWQKTQISADSICGDDANPEVYLDFDNFSWYMITKATDSKISKCSKIIRTNAQLYCQPLVYLHGKITSYHPIYSTSEETIFEITGENLKIVNTAGALILNIKSCSLLRYNRNHVEVLANEKDGLLSGCTTILNHCLYYFCHSGKPTENDILMKYYLEEKKSVVIPLQKGQGSVPSYDGDFYLYTDKEIKRISDGKVITIDAVMQAIHALHLPEEKELSPFPEQWYFHKHWLEAETTEQGVFAVNLETMQAYFSAIRIDFHDNTIYVFQ